MKAPMKLDEWVLRRDALEKENQEAISIERKFLKQLGKHPRIVPSVITPSQISMVKELAYLCLQIPGRPSFRHPALRGIVRDSAGLHRLQSRRDAHISAVGFLRTTGRGSCAHPQQGRDPFGHATG